MEAAATPTTEQNKAAIWEDFIDIFYAPKAVYRRRADAGFWLPLIILSALMALLFYAAASVLVDASVADIERAMLERGATAEQMAQAANVPRWLPAIGMLFNVPIMILISALLVWLISKALSASLTYRGAGVIAVYAAIPGLLNMLSMAIQGLFLDGLDSMTRVGLGPARFLDPDSTSNAVLAIAAQFDLFTIWGIVLVAIGLSVVGRIPMKRAAAGALVLWLLQPLPTLLMMSL